MVRFTIKGQISWSNLYGSYAHYAIRARQANAAHKQRVAASEFIAICKAIKSSQKEKKKHNK